MIKNRQPATGFMDRLFQRYPLLRRGYREAVKRFGRRNGVVGFGIGRQFSETATKYGKKPSATGGLCIKVFVERKHPDLSRSQRIPKSLKVPGDRNKMTDRVLLDVVTVGELQGNETGELQDGKGWPNIGCINTGHVFAFGKENCDKTPAEFEPAGVRLGTVGALIRSNSNDLYAVSAGHVFSDPCTDNFACPIGERAIGVKDRTWSRTDTDCFVPLTLKTNDLIVDVMAFLVPKMIQTDDVTWPDGFVREFATDADIERALKSTTANGFLWVERGEGRPKALPVDLEAQLVNINLKVPCRQGDAILLYGQCYALRFIGDGISMRGDSGAGVYLWDEDNAHCRFLGYHFYRFGKRSYAMDARLFFDTSGIGSSSSFA